MTDEPPDDILVCILDQQYLLGIGSHAQNIEKYVKVNVNVKFHLEDAQFQIHKCHVSHVLLVCHETLRLEPTKARASRLEPLKQR